VTKEEGQHRTAAWAKHVADLLRDAMPGSNAAGFPFRGDQAGQMEPEVPVFKVSVSVGTLPNVRRALRYAQQHGPMDRLPLAVIKDEGHKQQFVAMPLDAFLLLVSGWWAATQPVAPVDRTPPAPEVNAGTSHDR
jgi:hypothetical protein